jgi:hypothetical protein
MCSQLPSKGALLANLSTTPTPATSEACGICGNPFGQKYFDRPDTQWLSMQAIAASLTTSQLKHCSSNIDVKTFAELCTYRRTKIQELVKNEVMDSQPINAMEFYFLERNCAVTYNLDLPTLFGHAASEYFIIRKLEQYSVDQDRVSDEQLINLPLREKRELVHEQDGYAYVTITPELQMIAKDAHPG